MPDRKASKPEAASEWSTTTVQETVDGELVDVEYHTLRAQVNHPASACDPYGDCPLRPKAEAED